MKKSFKLPKEITEKWLLDLRNEDYKQCQGSLCEIDEEHYNEDDVLKDGIEPKTASYCCLGLLAVTAEIPLQYIGTNGYPSEMHCDVSKYGYPKELTGDTSMIPDLSVILASLNDGSTVGNSSLTNYETIKKYPDIIIQEDMFVFHDEEKTLDVRKHTFEQIAVFIEKNVELY